MIAVLILAVVAVATQATPVVYRPAVYSRPEAVYVQPVPITYTAPLVVKEAPKPYSFGYEAPAIGGGSSRHETSDGNGRVTGSYTVADADGRLRVVDYYADETGFHANVKTNEPGTANQDSADVSVQSYAAPVAAPVVAPQIVAAPAPVYAVAPVRTVARRVVAPAPVSYGVLPAYNSLSYATPVTTYSDGYYGNPAPYYGSAATHYGSYVPKSDYYYYK